MLLTAARLEYSVAERGEQISALELASVPVYNLRVTNKQAHPQTYAVRREWTGVEWSRVK